MDFFHLCFIESIITLNRLYKPLDPMVSMIYLLYDRHMMLLENAALVIFHMQIILLNQIFSMKQLIQF